MAESLASIQCALVGGETAEMPGVYQEDEFDLAGFAVGVVNRKDIIDGSGIAIGNKIIGLGSSGLHSNGFSLVRKILRDSHLDLRKTYPGLDRPLGEILLEPTLIYVNPVLLVQKQFPILGIAHITGGGLVENIPRILPKQTQAVLDPHAWPLLPVFNFLQKKGGMEEFEMHRVFNCGIGMILVVPEENAHEIEARFQGAGFAAYLIGEIAARSDPEQAQVSFLP
jgi:phosphoribosylformylglycinamidine cyclo-ligase